MSRRRASGKQCPTCGTHQPGTASFCGWCGGWLEAPGTVRVSPTRQPLALFVVALTVISVVAFAVTRRVTDVSTSPDTEVVLPTEGTSQLPAGVPVACPMTLPIGDFEPPDEYKQGFDPPPQATQPSAEELRWYGSVDLWTALDPDGEVVAETEARGEFIRRYFLWSVHQEPARDEPTPAVVLTAERVDGEGPTVHSTEATHGFIGSNLFMITGLVLPRPGCWKVTAEYRGHDLTWTIWADPESMDD